jgi:hypothetical protein
VNRQMRREAARAKRMEFKPRRSWTAINRPLPHEVNMVFAPIDAFLRKLATGVIECAQNGAPIFDDVEGQAYEATPAVRGFVSAFNRILDHYGFEIDTTPIIRLCNKLDANMPINEMVVAHCQGIVDRCRMAYRTMDMYQVKALVNTELIDLEFKRLKVTHEAA